MRQALTLRPLAAHSTSISNPSSPHRKPGQGGDVDHQARDLRAELEAAEAAHFAKVKGGPSAADPTSAQAKRPLGLTSGGEDDESARGEEEAKRRRILEESRDVDADDSDSDGGGEGADDDDDDSESDEDSDDEEAELQRELERVRRERAEKREKEVRGRVFLCITPFCH